MDCVWKSQKKVAFNKASEVSGQKFLKNANVLKTWSLPQTVLPDKNW